MSWEDFFGGGPLYSQMQGQEMGGLEKLLYQLQSRSKDASMRYMWKNGENMPRPQFQPEAPDMWKEMLEREMWRRRPTMFQNGVNGAMPSLQQQMQRMPYDGSPNKFNTLPDFGGPKPYREMNMNIIGRRG